jgi:hypothetical protein
MQLIRPRAPIPIAGAAAVTPLGFEWRGLSKATAAAARVPPLPDVLPPRLAGMASPAARFAALAMKLCLDDAGWQDGREHIGVYLGVGASGGAMSELDHMLAESLEQASFAGQDSGTFSLARFGKEGLAACNPLFAFQLMNNFTLCHGAILSGLGGPNGAFFSRGAGTFEALGAAIDALDGGDCARALAGGADTALHPVTEAELRREGCTAVLSEGAALLALGGPPSGAVLEGWAPGECDEPCDVVIGPLLGEALAATPAIAWVAALDAIHAGARRVLVRVQDLDGSVGTALFGAA